MQAEGEILQDKTLTGAKGGAKGRVEEQKAGNQW